MSAAETIFRCRDSNEEASAQQHNSAASATRRDFLLDRQQAIQTCD
jgi:hypothetical protein